MLLKPAFKKEILRIYLIAEPQSVVLGVLAVAAECDHCWGVVACVASVSVRFRSKERGTRVKDPVKNGTSKRG